MNLKKHVIIFSFFISTLLFGEEIYIGRSDEPIENVINDLLSSLSENHLGKGGDITISSSPERPSYAKIEYPIEESNLKDHFKGEQ